MKKITLSLFLIVGSILLNCFSVNAATITRYVKEGGSGNGTSWANASGELQQMVDEVFGNAEKGTVLVAAGKYIGGFVMRDGVDVFGGYPAEGGNTRDLKNNKTYLDGDYSQRVLWQKENELFEYTTTWDGFYIQNGNELGAGAFISYRGVVSNCVIRNNTTKDKTWQKGGGVAMKKSSAAGAPSMSGSLYNCVIINNYAGEEGGGVFVENNSACDIINCVIANNESASSCGGVFLGDWNGWSRIQNNIIWGNEGGTTQLIQKNGPLLALYNNLIDVDDVTSIKGYDPTGREAVYTTAHVVGNITGEGIDPMFVNPTTFFGTSLLEGDWDEILGSDWNIEKTSPCVDTGTDKDIPIRISGADPNTQPYSSVLITDIIGANRIQGTAPDMGAYEVEGGLVSISPEIKDMNGIWTKSVNGSLKVSGLESGDKILLYNISGVLSSTQTASVNEVNVAGLTGGIYILKVSRGSVEYIQKVAHR